MEITQEVARYIVGWYVGLMNDVEHKAQWHLDATMKASHGQSDSAAQQAARTHNEFGRFLSDDPEVLRLVQDGYDSFILRTAARILNDHRDQLFLNRCARCGELARTPRAKQCRSCGFDWH